MNNGDTGLWIRRLNGSRADVMVFVRWKMRSKSQIYGQVNVCWGRKEKMDFIEL